jgi:hypothetical protein
MSIHPLVLEAIQEIDAAFFSGDSFHDEAELKEIERFLIRWGKKVANIHEMLNERSEEDEPCPECGDCDCNGQCMECP